LTTYLALLRGVNVGGASKVPMKELRTLFEDLGHQDVRTYLRSGNVVFVNRSSTPKELAAEAEAAVSKAFDLRISIMMRTRRELERVAGGNPWDTAGVPASSLHVMFLAESVSRKAIAMLDSDRSPPDQFEVRGSEVYLWFPKGSGRSKLTVDYFEKKLGTRATARNWNTILKVVELMKRS
jgi:uncharacterized protein (DUF1697 family)